VVSVAEHTGIEWCDATFNPWWGCERVSPACAHCYADTLAHRFGFYSINGEGGLWGDGHSFRFFGDKHWQEPLKWARLLPAKLGRRPRVFCASMADVFEERPELEEPRRRLFRLIEATRDLDWLVLTKRPEFARDWLFRFDAELAQSTLVTRDDDHFGWGCPPNLWLGVSIENARFTRRADVLREIPAAVRFISAEPLLGSLFETRLRDLPADPTSAIPVKEYIRKPLDPAGIDWLIAGGESGPRARPSHPDWFRELRDACSSQGTAFLFKQWGEWAPLFETDDREAMSQAVAAHSHHHPATRRRMFGDALLERRGKRASGRELDGRTWDQFPASWASVVA
jgi:protein gp37